MRIGTIVAAGLMLGLAAEAEAVTLAAGPLGLGGSGQESTALECAIVNVGGSPVSVTVTARFREQEPSVLGPVTLLPGQANALREANEQSSSREGYCVFDVIGRPNNVRATASVVDLEGNRQASVEAY